MGRKLYISDSHLGHKNAIEFDNRPFADVEEMDALMIEYWNMAVQKDDEVYIIGDFCYRSNKGPVWYLQRLSGIKHLIVGNHDAKTLKYPGALDHFESVEHIKHVRDDGKDIVLCHYPIAEWSGYYRGAWHIYGHIHGKLNEACLFMREKKRALNAAACINGYRPVTMDELIENNRRFVEKKPLNRRDLPPVGF